MGGKRLAYGARALVSGGLQALPQLAFPGGALIGDDAGFLVASRIKGSHAAIKSGSMAAEAAHEALTAGRGGDALAAYPEKFRNSWLYDELHTARNFKPWMAKGLYVGSVMFGMDQMLLRGRAPWTLGLTADHTKLKPAAACTPIDYPRPDGVLSFDRLSSVFLSNTNHEEDQPCHLKLGAGDAPKGYRGHKGSPLGGHADQGQPRALRRPRAALLPGRRIRDRARRGQHAASADQCPELRALQDLRHQGPDAEHHLGDAAGRRRADLRNDVAA